MTKNVPHQALEQLRAANPVTETSLDAQHRARAEKRLQELLDSGAAGGNVVSLSSRRAKRNSWWASAAAVVLLAVAGLTVPGVINKPVQATAAEVLLAAGEASGAQPDYLSTGVTNQAYLKRVDTLGETTLVTEYEAPVGAEPTAHSVLQGPDNPALRLAAQLPVTAGTLSQAETAEQLLDLAGGTPRGLVQLLLHPSLTSSQHQLIYQSLAGMGIKLGGHGDVAEFSAGDLRFSVLVKTGQLIAADNLVASGVHTQVQATAILGCVATPNVEGPAEISLGCADNNYLLRDMAWTNWGADSATATATAVINDCDPFCAQGTFKEFPVTVTVSQRQECGYNARLYSKLEVYPLNPADKNLKDVYNIGCAR